MRTAFAFLVCLAVIPPSAAECHAQESRPEQTRTALRLFQYGGAESGVGQNAFGRFRSSLENNVIILSEVVRQRSMIEYGIDFLKDIRVSFSKNDLGPNNIREMEKYFSKSEYLALLRGEIGATEGGAAGRSLFYIGHINNALRSKVVDLPFRFRAEDYSADSDAHMIVVLYCLILEAVIKDMGNTVVSVYLDTAQERIEDYEAKSMGDRRNALAHQQVMSIKKALAAVAERVRK